MPPRPKSDSAIGSFNEDDAARDEVLTQRRHTTLPIGKDMHAPELAPHFRSLQQHVLRTRYRTKIDATNLHMKIQNRDTGATYVAIALPNEFTPCLAVVRPHVSLVHDVAPPDWTSWYEMKHTLTTLLNPRDVTCFFQAGNNPYKYVIDERSELGVLIRMMQRIIRNYHPANRPIDVVQELHFTFNQVGHHTV